MACTHVIEVGTNNLDSRRVFALYSTSSRLRLVQAPCLAHAACGLRHGFFASVVSVNVKRWISTAWLAVSTVFVVVIRCVVPER